jgi:hypothetical protein
MSELPERSEYELSAYRYWSGMLTEALMRSGDDAAYAPIEGGTCGECERESSIRFAYGRFELCRSCMTRRHKTRALLPEPDLLETGTKPA